MGSISISEPIKLCCGNNSSEKAAQNSIPSEPIPIGGNTQLSTTSTKTNSGVESTLLSSMLGSSTISLSSEDSGVSESEDCVTGSNLTMEAAAVAAVWMSRGEHVTGLGSRSAISGKLRIADWPRMVRAATSWARAAISGVENVPSQIRDFLRGSRISDTHLPQFRFRTPWYTGCLLQSLGLLLCFWAWALGPECEEEEVVVCCVIVF